MTEIVTTDGVRGGEPHLEGRRISVLQVADTVLDAGHSPEYVADQLDMRHRDLEAELRDQSISPDRVEQ